MTLRDVLTRRQDRVEYGYIDDVDPSRRLWHCNPCCASKGGGFAGEDGCHVPGGVGETLSEVRVAAEAEARRHGGRVRAVFVDRVVDR